MPYFLHSPTGLPHLPQLFQSTIASVIRASFFALVSISDICGNVLTVLSCRCSINGSCIAFAAEALSGSSYVVSNFNHFSAMADTFPANGAFASLET
jgi:hypothetical protein